jgi:predicted RNase H-like HicB family nuclease
MKSEFTAIIEPAIEGGFWAVCPEVPGANGQGETLEETRQSLVEAIELLTPLVGERIEGMDVPLERVRSTELESLVWRGQVLSDRSD